MDIPKFKDLIQKIDIFRNYSSLLVPVILTLVAVFLFIPTQLMSSRLRKKVTSQSVSMGRQVQSLVKEAQPNDQWTVEQQYQQAHKNDADKVALLAKQSTQRPLLSYKIFPEPNDPSDLIFDEFGQRFNTAIDALMTRCNALDCPTEVEMNRHLPSSGYGSSRPRAGRGGAGRGRSRGSNEVSDAIIDELCRKKAESAFIYANPADLSGYEFWAEYEYPGRKQAVEDCWYWQLAYWIIEDVIDTADALNSGSNSVFTSPVKRLITVSFGADVESRPVKKAAASAGRPRYVLSIEDGLTQSPTRRVSNDDIDVVHFNISVVVNAKAVLPFMQQLCSAKQHKFRGFSGNQPQQIFRHNQITVLESKIETIDHKEKTLYRYGEDSIVRLDLICEYIFNKDGYDVIKPKSVKELFEKSQKKTVAPVKRPKRRSAAEGRRPKGKRRDRGKARKR